MPLQFISHREIAFRQLLGMLRTPPFAMLSYYSNLFISAKMVFSDFPDKVRHLDKEIRRVECMVGVQRTEYSSPIQYRLRQIAIEKAQLENDLRRLNSMFTNADEKMRKELVKTFEEVQNKVNELNGKEHYLLFKLQPMIDLKQIETYTDNNINLKSFFKEAGQKITQLELTSELDKIKSWVYSEASELMPFVRFTKLE